MEQSNQQAWETGKMGNKGLPHGCGEVHEDPLLKALGAKLIVDK